MQCSGNFLRAISVIDYILEDNGHTTEEAAIEFNCHHSTILRDINLYGSTAFYCNLPNAKEMQVKYIKVQKTLKRLAKENKVNNIAKWNARNAKNATSN